MLIGVLGHTDKRPVVYALIKLLQATGDIAFFSKNTVYKRLLENQSDVGHMANVLMAITESSPDEVFAEIEHTVDDFEHVIFDVQDSVPENVDLLIYVKTSAYEDGEQDLLEIVGDYTTIKMCYDGKSEKGAINVGISGDLFKAIELVEVNKLLLKMPSRNLNAGLAKLLAPKLNLQPKAALKILTRGWKSK